MATVEQVLSVARGQLGYNGEGRSDNPSSKYGAWYGINPGHWCAMFVSWCLDQAGERVSIETAKGFALVVNGRAHYARIGRLSGPQITPSPGDLVFFNFEPGNHVGIVESATSPGAVTSIQGNTNDVGQGRTGNCCRRKVHGNRYVTGYGHPEYDGGPAPAPGGQYTVIRGDSLWSIAAALLGDGARYPEIMWLNGLTSTVIQPGDTLAIPGVVQPPAGLPVSTYTVVRGDILWNIAARLLGDGARYPEIARLNNLADPSKIYVGQVLRIPPR